MIDEQSSRLARGTTPGLVLVAMAIALLVGPLAWEAQSAYPTSPAPWQRCLRASGANKARLAQGRIPDWYVNVVLCEEAVRLESETSKVSLSLAALAYAYEGLEQLDSAAHLYLEAISLMPRGDPGLYFSLAGVYRKQGRSGDALATYEALIKIDPDDPKGYERVGETYVELGRWQEAARAFAGALDRGSSQAETYLGLGEAYENLDRLEEALASYYRAISIKREFAPAFFGLGRIYQRQGRLGPAITAYREALRLDSTLGDAYFHLGEAYSEEGMVGASIASYREAVRLRPESPQARFSLGVAYAMDKRRALADDYLYQAAQLYIEEGDREGALKAYGHLRNLRSPMAERVYKRLYP